MLELSPVCLGIMCLKFYRPSITIALLTPEISLCIFNELWEVVFADSVTPVACFDHLFAYFCFNLETQPYVFSLQTAIGKQNSLLNKIYEGMYEESLFPV